MVVLKFPSKVLLILEKERNSLYSENPRATDAGRHEVLIAFLLPDTVLQSIIILFLIKMYA